MKRVISMLLAMLLTVPVLADDYVEIIVETEPVTISETAKQAVEVEIVAEPLEMETNDLRETPYFSVTIPAVMTVVVSENGAVYTATNAAIINNSTDAIEITDIMISPSGGWTLVPYDTNMAAEKVDSRLIGFMLNGVDGTVDNLSIEGDWTVDQGDELALFYDAVVSATSQVIYGEEVLTVVFVVDWAD